MASKQASIAKDKGNEAFKAGDYPTAIGHYSSAILADRNDPTFSLNRAAAYLKLGKNEDAERDCTTVLALSPSNVKALFRRGQARMGLDRFNDARQDFQQALKVDPLNDAAKQELAKLDSLQQKTQSKAQAHSEYRPAAPASAAPKRRRIPIKIVELDDASSGLSSKLDAKTAAVQSKVIPSTGGDMIKPVSSRSISSKVVSIAAPQKSEDTTKTSESSSSASTPSSASTSAPSAPKSSTFKDAKQARDNTKSSRVGGGIFRPTGNHTLFDRQDGERSPSSVSPPQASSSAAASIREIPEPASTNINGQSKPPGTLFQFTRSWELLKSDEDRWQLIKSVSPSYMPTLFQTSLEASLLASILRAFLYALTEKQDKALDEARDRIKEYMVYIPRTTRFGTVVLFLNPSEKDLVKSIWTRLGEPSGGAAWRIDI